MNPTASTAAEVECCKCGTKITGNIDQIFATGWLWFSDDKARYFWCPTCAALPEFKAARKVARAAKETADADPRREEKLAAREAARKAEEARRGN